ncbi:uncharacterized protein LOC126100120 isoform X2 [Schistocerca cancellata]|uniref:uncharacterized protein LOC126100120 isoform X2 n=1 Tax=Schistocerca cancellata TaxID=274614 RepID=UPI00211978B1|nr:uncharacterized protein LOC126100120 isoform X2 [Schistocerca cancellata]
MAPKRRAVALLHVACLLAAARLAIGSDTVLLRPRGWPQVECELSSLHAAHGDDSRADFWMRGWLSRQFYRCRLDATDDVRDRLFAASQGGLLPLTARWTINLNKGGGRQYPELTTSPTPSFACATDGVGAPSTLPAALFPLRARRRTVGRVGQWHKCVRVSAGYHPSPFTAGAPLVRVAFRGGAPTVVCGMGDASRSAVPAVQMRGLLGAPYSCFFASYLDFPALKGPPVGLVFQRQILNKWTTKESDTDAAAFLPSQCWPAEDSTDESFDFDVDFDGKHAQRCRFQGDCPLCGQDVSPTQPSTVSFTTAEESASPDETTVTVAAVARRAHSRPKKVKAPGSKPLLFERRLCTYHSLDENNSTVVHQISCFG